MSEDKKKVLIIGDLVTPTGFARVLHSIIKNIESEYDITGVGVNYRGDPHNLNIPVYPASLGGTIYGERRVTDILNQAKFDIVFILNDSWVIDKYLKAFKKEVTKELPKIVVYFPVDSADHDPEWYNNFDIVSQAVTYTEFGKQVIKKAAPNVNVEIIPHGIDNSVFFKKYKTKGEAKLNIFGDAIKKFGDPETSFIVLNANRNQPRKKLDVTMNGFALFARRKPENVKLYMHCGIVDSHMNVGKMMARLGIDNRLIVSSDKRGVQVLPESRLNDIYNACDVGINTSLGEGWGLTNVEHAVTDSAQIVPDHSACKELFYDCGVLLPTLTNITFDNSMTVGRLTTPEAVAEKLEYLYSNRKVRDAIARAGMEKFTDPKYSWEEISKQWTALFEKVTENPVKEITEDVSTLAHEH